MNKKNALKVEKLTKIYVCVRFRPGAQLADRAPVLLFRALAATGRCSTSHFVLQSGFIDIYCRLWRIFLCKFQALKSECACALNG